MPSYIRIQISLVLALSTCSSVLSDRLPFYGHTFDQKSPKTNLIKEFHQKSKLIKLKLLNYIQVKKAQTKET